VATTHKMIKQGIVVSDKNDKTIVVRVDRQFIHPLYKKPCADIKNLWHMMKITLPTKVILFKLWNHVH